MNRTVPEIIAAAGGAKVVAGALDGAVSVDAIYKWPKIGVPDRHWPALIAMAGATAEELFEANRMARGMKEAGE